MSLNSNQRPYIPSYESRLASQSRVAKINQLYAKTKHHRTSVASNNSTSVASFEDDSIVRQDTSGNCHPISLASVPQSVSRKNDRNEDDTVVTIKHEDISNPFHNEIMNNNSDESIASDENYQDELQFTPRLRSRRSIISIRTSSESTPLKTEERRNSFEDNFSGDRSNLTVYHDSLKKRGKFSELKQILGDPVPLPYLNRTNDDTLSKGTGDVKSRWKRLVSQDKETIEQRLREIRQGYAVHTDDGIYSEETSNESGGDKEGSELVEDMQENETHTASINDHIKINTKQQLRELRDTLKGNTERLDQIIRLLGKKQNDRRREIVLWTICIIILIICNICVYYYL